MEKVVYILGAGFSAPLGLPVMSNFLVKSKDMFAAEPERYRHFDEVFKTINEMHVCKSYFDADLWNIEEILSILEMREGLEASSEVRSFVDYITDVIKFYTPSHRAPGRSGRPDASWDLIFGYRGNSALPNYAAFVSSLFSLKFTRTVLPLQTQHTTKFSTIEQPKAAYSVISLNYDSVLENGCSFLSKHYPSEKTVKFRREFDLNDTEDALSIPLAKLHGSVDSGDIIAPTWNKSLQRKLVSQWKKAHELVSDANHIRILGYSLPASDGYIKYLLKSAVVKARNLKSIDIICKGHEVRQRYEAFVHFNFRRFKEADVADYLSEIYRVSLDTVSPGNYRDFDKLEPVHAAFMEG